MMPQTTSETARVLPINWFDLAWQPRLTLRRARIQSGCARTSQSLSPRRSSSVKSKPMKPSLRLSRRPAGFTLIELLTVIAIIGILAGLLLPVLSRVKLNAYKGRAKTEMSGLVTAIGVYESQYGRMPTSSAASGSLTGAGQGGCPDFTFGTVFGNGPGVMQTHNTYANAAGGLPAIKTIGNTAGSQPNYQANNSEVMSILMDQTTYPAGGNTPNFSHAKNPQQTKFFEGHPSPDTFSPGVGPDLVYRDPWGDPYIITLDMNGDGRCRDGFYRGHQVSQQTPSSPIGFIGLNNAIDTTGASDDYEAPVTVMVWSLGRDGGATNSANAINGLNKDNLTSWQQ